MTKTSKPVVVLDFALLSICAAVLPRPCILLTYSPRFRQMVEDAVERSRQGDTLTGEGFWTQLRNRRAQRD